MSPDLSDFERSLSHRFFLRLHMGLILSGVILSGVVASKLLLQFGLTFMLVRYLIAVTFSYAVFFLLVRVWVWYIERLERRAPPTRERRATSLPDVLNIFSTSDSDSGAISSGGHFGGGGDFGGGGAGGTWGSVGRGGDTSGSGGNKSDNHLSLNAIVVLVVFSVLLIIIFGAGAYIVYQAPAILAEAAFQVVLASGLVKSSRQISRFGWMRGILKATLVPFAIVLAMTTVFGLVAAYNCPEATKVTELLGDCKPSE
jgi:hypothetical protein